MKAGGFFTLFIRVALLEKVDFVCVCGKTRMIYRRELSFLKTLKF
jgi:hypothetical protein